MINKKVTSRQQKKHRYIEQSFGLCGRERGWCDLGEWHWNMYNIICETNHQSRFDAWYRMLGAGALGWLRGMVWGGKWEGGSGWGTCIPVADSCWCMAKPIQYCKVISLQLNKFILKKSIYWYLPSFLHKISICIKLSSNKYLSLILVQGQMCVTDSSWVGRAYNSTTPVRMCWVASVISNCLQSYGL